jgi:hypothetical protein
VGRQSQRPLVTSPRLASPTLRGEDVAEIVVKGRVAVVARNCSLDVFDRIIGPSLLMFDKPEQMQRRRMSGVARQNQAANPFRLGGATGALMRKGRAEPIGDWRSPSRGPILTRVARAALRAALFSIHCHLIA